MDLLQWGIFGSKLILNLNWEIYVFAYFCCGIFSWKMFVLANLTLTKLALAKILYWHFYPDVCSPQIFMSFLSWFFDLANFIEKFCSGKSYRQILPWHVFSQFLPCIVLYRQSLPYSNFYAVIFVFFAG